MTRSTWGIVVLALAAIGVASWKVALADRLETMREINLFINRENVKLAREVSEVQRLPVEIAEYVRQKAIRDAAIGNAMPAAEALSELSRLPAGVVLQRAFVKGRRLTAYGEADSDAALAGVLPALSGARHAGKFKLEPEGGESGSATRRFRLEGEVALPTRGVAPGGGS